MSATAPSASPPKIRLSHEYVERALRDDAGRIENMRETAAHLAAVWPDMVELSGPLGMAARELTRQADAVKADRERFKLGTTPSGKLIHWFRDGYPVCGQKRGLAGNGHFRSEPYAKVPSCPHCVEHEPVYLKNY